MYELQVNRLYNYVKSALIFATSLLEVQQKPDFYLFTVASMLSSPPILTILLLKTTAPVFSESTCQFSGNHFRSPCVEGTMYSAVYINKLSIYFLTIRMRKCVSSSVTFSASRSLNCVKFINFVLLPLFVYEV